MEQSPPLTVDAVAAQQAQQADDNKAKALEWLRARVAQAQAVYLTIGHDDLARVTYRGFLGHEPPHYFYFKTEPRDEVYGIDFNVQALEIEAPRTGLGIGESVLIYRAQTSSAGGVYRGQRNQNGTTIRVHTATMF